MTNLIPRPLNDIIMNPIMIKSFKNITHQLRPGSGEAAFLGTFAGGFFVMPLSIGTIKAVVRMASSFLEMF